MLFRSKGVASNNPLKDNSVPENSSFLNHRGFNFEALFTFNSLMDQSQQEVGCFKGQEIKEMQNL